MSGSGRPGACALCGVQAASLRLMAGHLDGCEAAMNVGGPRESITRLAIEAPGFPDHWLLIDCLSSATLAQLDAALRLTWLECCGHLSAFRNGRLELAEHTRISELPQKGVAFDYDYDFGSTTSLRGRVVSERVGSLGGGPVVVAAQNLPPVRRCALCHEPATQVCPQCRYTRASEYCSRHAEEHPCADDTGMLPLANSPRAGVCGYTGPTPTATRAASTARPTRKPRTAKARSKVKKDKTGMDAQLAALAATLSHPSIKDGAMDVSMLDGLLTSLVIGPRPVMPSEFLPWVFDIAEGKASPVFERREDAERMFGTIMEMQNRIASALQENPPRFEPLFTLDPRYRPDAWVNGFDVGLAFATEEWQEAHKRHGAWFMPLTALGDFDMYDATDPVALDAVVMLRQSVRDLQIYFREIAAAQHARAHTPFVRTGPKVGRNDPCPCGSGRKHKKCCGVSPVVH